MNRLFFGVQMSLLALGHAALAVEPASASRANPAWMGQVDTVVRAEMQRQQVPGVAIGVLSKGEVVAARGYGESNVELRVPASPETVFQSGSVGKQFTAAAVMLQVEDGKLALDDSVTKYLHGAPARWRPITVRNLLTHTSGIPDYTESLEEHASQGINFRRDYTEEELTRAAFRLPLEFAPGSRWKYSNTGYLLLGVIIHKVTGQFYGDVLRQRVFAPLGMKTARIISEEDIVPNRAAGYRLVNGALKNQEWVAPSLNTTADGALYLSTLDFLAWARGLRSQAILKPQSWAAIYTPVTLKSGKTYPYGFGWFIDESEGKPWYRHSGSWQGFRTYISRYLADDLTIIVLTNLAEARPQRFVDAIAQLIDPGLAKIAPSAPLPDRAPAVTARVGKLLRAAGAGTLAPRDLPYLRGNFAAQAREYEELARRLGAPQRIELVAQRELGDDHSFTYVIACAAGTLRVQIALAPDDRVSDFDMEAD